MSEVGCRTLLFGSSRSSARVRPARTNVLWWNIQGQTAMDLAPNEETREILRRAPQIRQDFLERQRGEAGPPNVLANIAAAEPANVVTAIGAMAEAVATTALAAVQPRVRELEARVSALEAELTEERSARAAEREREVGVWHMQLLPGPGSRDSLLGLWTLVRV